jgi:hypothetical protein
MSIQTMIFAAQDAADKGEVPTIEQYMTFMTAMHEMEVRMPEFLWFDKTCEDMADTAYLAKQAAKGDEQDYPQDMHGFEGTRGQLDALTLRMAA